MRPRPQQHIAFMQRFPHEAESVLFKITQTTVNELGRCRGRAGAEIALFDQQHLEATAGSIARDADPVDTAADHGEIEIGHALLEMRPELLALPLHTVYITT